MKNKDLKRHFEAMGAKVKFHLTEKVRWRWDQSSDHFTIGIQVDKNGEYFDIVQGGDAPEFELLQAQPKTQHLLLYCFIQRRVNVFCVDMTSGIGL